jgi:hypothetical protein
MLLFTGKPTRMNTQGHHGDLTRRSLPIPYCSSMTGSLWPGGT